MSRLRLMFAFSLQVPSALAEAPTVYTVGDGEETADIEGICRI